MYKEGEGKPNTQLSNLQRARSTLKWPTPIVSNGPLSEILNSLISGNPAELATAAWDLREAASKGHDISGLLPFIGPLIKSETSTVQQNLIDAVMHYVKGGGNPSSVMSAVSHCLQSNSMPLRQSALLTLAYHSQNCGDISLYLDLITSRLRDISQSNREAASLALISYASRSPEEAHNVFMALGDVPGTEADSVRFVCRDALKK